MTFSHHVYILFCSDGMHHTGCTNDLDDRMICHGRGEVHFTQSRLPVGCVTAFGFNDKYLAYNFEKCLKAGSGRAFMKRHLIITKKAI